MPKAFKQVVVKVKLSNDIEICFYFVTFFNVYMELKAEIRVEINYLSEKGSLLLADYTMPSTSKTLSPRCKKPD